MRSMPAWWWWPMAPTACARRLERVLTTDPGMGVIRHADAGYPKAIEVAHENGIRIPMESRDREQLRVTNCAQLVTLGGPPGPRTGAAMRDLGDHRRRRHAGSKTDASSRLARARKSSALIGAGDASDRRRAARGDAGIRGRAHPSRFRGKPRR